MAIRSASSSPTGPSAHPPVPAPAPTPRSVVVMAVLALALLVGACATSTAAPSAAPGEPVDGPAAVPAVADPVPSPRAEVARPTTTVDVRDAPGGAVSAVLAPTTDYGSARALLVVGRHDDLLEVALPTRPNGSTGFIAADGVEVRQVDLAVEIDLAARTLVVTDGDDTVVATTVAIGAPDTPTPTGEFYVTDKLATEDPDGPYGPFALGLSAHSDVLTEFAGGDGQVGIHGTSTPASIGQPVSNGCIRVPNDVATALNDLLPLGTPVGVR